MKFTSSMLKSSLCDYYWCRRTTTIVRQRDHTAAVQEDERSKEVIFKHWTPFTNCISEINNTEIDNAKDLDVVMPMYNLIEYNDNNSKTSEDLRQYYRDGPALHNNVNMANFPGK